GYRNQAVSRQRRFSMRERRRRTVSARVALGAVAVLCMWSPARLRAQPSSGTLTLTDAVQLALKNYPALKQRRARAQAGQEAVHVARTAYLPRFDVMWQENRGTTNNVFGLLFPQSTIFSMTGPVLGTRSLDTSVWGALSARCSPGKRSTSDNEGPL